MTGYTYPVGEGKITELSDFVKSCALAFGYLMNYREGKWEDVPETLPLDPYFTERAQDTKQRLAELEAMTPEERLAMGEHLKQFTVESGTQCLSSYKEENDRIQAMIDKVNAWVPPSSEHEGLKKFMLQQLTSSLQSDKFTRQSLEETNKISAMDLFNEELESAKADVEYSERRLREHIEHIAKANEWLRQLRESLR